MKHHEDTAVNPRVKYPLTTPKKHIDRERVLNDVWKAIGKGQQPKAFARKETTVPVQLLEALLILCGEGDAPEDKEAVQ